MLLTTLTDEPCGSDFDLCTLTIQSAAVSNVRQRRGGKVTTTLFDVWVFHGPGVPSLVTMSSASLFG